MSLSSIIEINSDKIRISVKAGFLKIQKSDSEEKIAFDEIDVVIINSHGAQISNKAIMRLSEYGIPIVHCAQNAMPCALTLPCGQNVYRKERIESQISCSLPLKKKLWKEVVRAKILNQAQVLNINGQAHKDLVVLAAKVQSGDKGNSEAVAARRYWQRLFGSSFRRNPELPGINTHLNYAYAILRATMCRYITAAGLLPEIGIHHSNLMNPYCLADDLMEPYRPFMDLWISQYIHNTSQELSYQTKSQIISILDATVQLNEEKTSLRFSMQQLVNKLVSSFTHKKAGLRYPLISPDAAIKISKADEN